jgi:hypothetical protein
LQSNNNNHEERHMMERLLLATKCTKYLELGLFCHFFKCKTIQ